MCTVIVSAVLLCYLRTSSHLDFVFSQHALVVSAKTKLVAVLHHHTFWQLSMRAIILKRHPTASVHSQHFQTLAFWRWAVGVWRCALFVVLFFVV